MKKRFFVTLYIFSLFLVAESNILKFQIQFFIQISQTQVDILYYQFSNIGKETDKIIYPFSFYKPQLLWILAIAERDQSDNISDSN